MDAFPSWPGTNVKLRLVPLTGGRLNETTLFAMSPVHWTTDVGVAGDNDPSLHLPWPSGSMIAYVTYHASNAGTVELFDGTSWEAVGAIVGGNG